MVKKFSIVVLLTFLFVFFTFGYIAYSAHRHNWVYQSTTPSTCQVQGYAEYKCSICGAIKRDPLPLAEHQYIWKYYTTWHKTCAHDTFDEYQKRCIWCDQRDPTAHCKDMNHRGDGLMHRWEYEGWTNGYEYVTGESMPASKSPTCTDAGCYWESSGPCGYGLGNPPWGEPPYCTLVAYRKIVTPALGHSWGLWYFNRVILVTGGSSPVAREYVRTCSRCNVKEYYTMPFYDTLSPLINAMPHSFGWGNSSVIAMSASDSGGSGLKTVSYAFSNSKSKPSSGWNDINITPPGINSYSLNLDLENSGIWYLHMQATDYAGNTYYRFRGPYVAENLKITGVTIEGCWNHWRGQADIFGKRLTVEPHRFLSLERVKINIYTSGYTDKVVIRFSPELEAMQFTDKYGNMYDYAEKAGYYVRFPGDTTFRLDGSIQNNHVYWEYILPFAPSTKGWEDKRQRSPYSMIVTAYKGTGSVTYTVNDMDITGNIYDLIYIQPIK